MLRFFFFFSSRRRHTRYWRDWSSDVCSSDLHEVFRVFYDRLTDDDDRAWLFELIKKLVKDVTFVVQPHVTLINLQD